MQESHRNEAINRAIVLMSGGVDSYACAHFLQRKGWQITGLFVDYRHAASEPELDSFFKVCRRLGIPSERASIGSSATFGSGEIVGRNGLLTMVALAVADPSTKLIAMGLHAGTPYYDCSTTFCQRMDALVAEYTVGRVHFFAPFIGWSKNHVYEYCRAENLDLSITYSCEVGLPTPCGKCLSCKDRQLLNVR